MLIDICVKTIVTMAEKDNLIHMDITCQLQIVIFYVG